MGRGMGVGGLHGGANVRPSAVRVQGDVECVARFLSHGERVSGVAGGVEHADKDGPPVGVGDDVEQHGRREGVGYADVA